MKQQLSILMLMARSTFYKVLFLLFALAALETGLFYRMIPPEMGAGGGYCYNLESAVRTSGIHYVLAAVFVLLTLLLCTTGLEGKSRLGYTLRRLPVSERAIYLWQALYNALCYALLWGVQIVVAVALAKLYAALAPAEVVSNQTVVLAFYRTELFHAILPLEDVLLWVRNILFLLALGLATAQYPLGQRQGNRFPLLVLILAALVIYCFPASIASSGTNAAGSFMGALLLGSASVFLVISGRRNPDETA